MYFIPASALFYINLLLLCLFRRIEYVRLQDRAYINLKNSLFLTICLKINFIHVHRIAAKHLFLINKKTWHLLSIFLCNNPELVTPCLEIVSANDKTNNLKFNSFLYKKKLLRLTFIQLKYPRGTELWKKFLNSYVIFLSLINNCNNKLATYYPTANMKLVWTKSTCEYKYWIKTKPSN